MNIKPCYSVVLYCQESTMHEKKIYKDIARVVFQDIMQTYEIKPGYNPGMLTLKGGTIKMFASVDEKKEIVTMDVNINLENNIVKGIS